MEDDIYFEQDYSDLDIIVTGNAPVKPSDEPAKTSFWDWLKANQGYVIAGAVILTLLIIKYKK